MTVDEAAGDTRKDAPDPLMRLATEIGTLGEETVKARAVAAAAPSIALRESLSAIIKNVKATMPETGLGTLSAKEYTAAFDKTAQDIIAVALDHRTRADEIYQEAISLAEVVRQTGDLFCRRLTMEASKGAQVSQLMEEARTILAQGE